MLISDDIIDQSFEGCYSPEAILTGRSVKEALIESWYSTLWCHSPGSVL